MHSDSHILPTRLGRYELVDHIATGGMADVFLARSFGTQGFRKHVVIKRLRPGLARSPRFVQMFIQEARISAGLMHPNVVQIHELGLAPGPSGGVHYIAMEYIHGQDLTRIRRALCARGQTLEPALAVYCAVRVLRALAYAHGRSDSAGHALGLVHRDVSPHNVLISFQGQVKLVDFGIARLEGEAGAAGETSGDSSARAVDARTPLPGGGKYAYMSPEQAAGLPVTASSDVFSAGIVLWELLVGRRLFQHDDPREKLRRVRAAEVPDPRADNPAISTALWTLLQQIMALDPALRPTASQAEEALQTLLFDEGMRADAGALSRLMADLFVDEARRDPGGLDLEGLAGDLARLQRSGRSQLDAAPLDGRAHSLGGSDDDFGSGSGSGSGSTGTGTGTGTGRGTGTPFGPALGGRLRPALPALQGLTPGERKPVVVLVVEVAGFTEPSVHADPEEIARGHYRLLRRIRRVVDRHGGWLDRFHDDRVTVFFGLPRTGEHDVDHALACAGQLVRLARRLRRRGLGVSLCIGVNQGELALGRLDDGAVRGLRYLSRGGTTKVARQLSQLADLDQILVSDRVRAQAREHFHFRPGPTIRTRGRAEAGRSWRLAGRDTSVHATPGRWLARGDERDVIVRALLRVASGERVVLSVVGPAGCGKSRLLQELRDLAAARGVPVYAARAVPYKADRPLATLRDVLARVMGLPNDPELEQLQVGLSRLAGLGLDVSDIEGLGGLFGVTADQQGDLLSERRSEDLVRASGRFVRRLASAGPVLLAIEDAQHLSQLEVAVLHHIQAVTRDVPVLLLLTARASLAESLGFVDEEIVLGSLAPHLQQRLAAQLLGARQISPELAELILNTTEGSPRYVVALIEALREPGRILLVEGTATLVAKRGLPGLPEGLDGIIAARIDALSVPARQALQVAALIGSRFSEALLVQATGLSDPAPVVAELVSRGLIERERERDRLAFASELVAEVTARTLIGPRRRELHGLVAGAMERQLGLVGPHVGELAEHCAACGRLLDAARCGHQAGDEFRRQQQLRQAVAIWGKSLDWLAAAVDADADPGACLLGEALLHFKVGEARALLGEAVDARRHLRAALDAAFECEDAEIEARGMLELGRLMLSDGQIDMARSHLEAAHEATVAPGAELPWQREVAVESLESMGLLAYAVGDAEQAEQYNHAALDRAGTDDLLAARALLGLSSAHIRGGRHTQALQLLTLAGAKAAAAGDRILLGRVVNNTGLVHHGAGRFRDAIACFEEARDLRRNTGYRKGEATNLHNIGDAWVRLGRLGRAWAAFERSRDLAVAIGWHRGVVMNDVWMGWLEAIRPEGVGSVEALSAALRQAEGLGDRDTALTGQWLLGRLLRAQGRDLDGRTVLNHALVQARALGAAPICSDIEAALAAPPQG